MTSPRRRLDLEIVRRGLRTDAESARAAIAEGRVLVGGAPALKAARLVTPGEAVVVQGPPPRYVGRAGEKLHAALSRFAVEVDGRPALDVGSSTGGFTDCLLQHGADWVLAVDVGRNQLHERLRADPRVRCQERTDVRDLPASTDGGTFPLVTVDVSFTGLGTVLPAIIAQAEPGADLVLLVKPQFEADRAQVSRGRGVIRDPAVWSQVLVAVVSTLHDLGTAIMGSMVSPLHGADGNVEFLVHALAPGHDRTDLGHLDADALAATAAGSG